MLLNGPNLNLLGLRDPKIYGSATLKEIEANVRSAASAVGYNLEARQTNHEGLLIDWVHEAIQGRQCAEEVHVAGIILNAGGYTHTSIALRDAIELASNLGIPTVEVHLSKIHEREEFRHVSLLRGVCIGQVCGHGANGYTIGLDMLIVHFEKTKVQVRSDPLPGFSS